MPFAVGDRADEQASDHPEDEDFHDCIFRRGIWLLLFLQEVAVQVLGYGFSHRLPVA